MSHTSAEYQQDQSHTVTCLCFCKCDVIKGGGVDIQLGVWFPHHKSRVTLINFFEILSTYVYIFVQLRLCKYLGISVTRVYILSSNRAVVEGILPCAFPGCWGQHRSLPRVLPGFWVRAAAIVTPGLSISPSLLLPSLLRNVGASHTEWSCNLNVGFTKYNVTTAYLSTWKIPKLPSLEWWASARL